MAFPAATPVTTPVVATTVAVGRLLLLQLPPVDMSANVVVAPMHTIATPVIPDGFGLTVTGVVIVHPVPSE